MSKIRYENWTIIDWDGNPDLKLKCWRKSFGRGHVSIGIGDFKTISYSYGANSSDSIGSTRDRSAYKWPDQTEDEAKAMVDRNKGHYNHRDAEHVRCKERSEELGLT